MAYGDAEATRRASGINIVPREVGERVQAHLDELFAEKRIRPIVSERLPFEELPAALELLESRNSIGRVILSW
jgi:NADPH:quinone reductase-like Zn-dependent oxidoreductase